LGELIEVEIQPTIKRVRDTKAQTLIHGAHQRQKNVANCFSLVSSIVEGKRVLLVDDVYTSGATTKEATRMLLRAGVRGVTIFALAKAA
ncbi:MAG: phosphoribosyltransferase family protein, partial [Candidatus Levyibacteriota bacterium]